MDIEVDEKTGEVQVYTPTVRAAVSVDDAVAQWREYQELKFKISEKDDFQTIQGKDFPKKSFWRKIQRFFNLTVVMVSEREVKTSDSTYAFDVVYQATAPNGAAATGDGSCENNEKKDRKGNSLINSRHNTRSTAHTRAYNRAISNLVGGGEVSADEINDDTDLMPNTKSQANPPPQAPAHSTNLSGEEIAEKQIPFGQKFKNKATGESRKYKDVKIEELIGYSDWIKAERGLHRNNLAQEYVKDVEIYSKWFFEKNYADSTAKPTEEVDLSDIPF